MSDNYPPGVWHTMPGAPWNESEMQACAVCAREFFVDGVPRGACPDDVDTHAPDTPHGEWNDLCRNCEEENSLCVNACKHSASGFYLEPFHGTTYDTTDARRCPDCALEHGPVLTRFTRTLEPWKRAARCVCCGTPSRVGVAFTDGRTVPRAVTEFSSVCADCAARDDGTLSILIHAYTGRAASVACEFCNGAGETEHTDENGHDVPSDCTACNCTGTGDGRAACGACHGTGRVQRDGHAATCDACNGDGLTVAACSVCGAHGTAADVGTTCRNCGRGVIAEI